MITRVGENNASSFGYDISTIRTLYDVSTIRTLDIIYLRYSSIACSSQDCHELFLLKEKMGTKIFHATLQYVKIYYVVLIGKSEVVLAYL